MLNGNTGDISASRSDHQFICNLIELFCYWTTAENKTSSCRLIDTPTSFNEEDTDADLSNGSLDLRIHDLKLNSNGLESQITGGRRLVWSWTQALQACDPGFKSRRPHHAYLVPVKQRATRAQR